MRCKISVLVMITTAVGMLAFYNTAKATVLVGDDFWKQYPTMTVQHASNNLYSYIATSTVPIRTGYATNYSQTFYSLNCNLNSHITNLRIYVGALSAHDNIRVSLENWTDPPTDGRTSLPATDYDYTNQFLIPSSNQVIYRKLFYIDHTGTIDIPLDLTDTCAHHINAVSLYATSTVFSLAVDDGTMIGGAKDELYHQGAYSESMQGTAQVCADYYNGPDRTYCVDYYPSALDLQMQITGDNQSLSIDVPQDSGNYNSPITAHGNCYSDFNLGFMNAYTYASSTYTFFTPISCNETYHTWFFSKDFENGFYIIRATTTDQTAERLFYINVGGIANPNNPFEPTVNLENPFGSSTSATGTWSFLNRYGYVVMSLRPWSYILQIGNALIDAMDNATSSDWIADIQMPYSSINTTTTSSLSFIPGITREMFLSIPENYRTQVRGLSTIVLYASFVFMIWSLRRIFL